MIRREKIILIGGGGHCKSVIDVIELTGSYEILGIIEKEYGSKESILNYPIIGNDESLQSFANKGVSAIVTVGHIRDNSIRIKLYQLLKNLNFKIPNIISPLAYVSKHAQLGEGNVIMHYALVNAGAKIGNNCIINTKALVEHDAIIEDHCHISTGAIVNGGVLVREGTFVGSNSTSKEYIVISGFIKAGSVVR